MLEKVERCPIKPLQIIEEQRERMLPAREHPEEAPEDHLEAILRLLRRQIRHWRLFSDPDFQLGNEVDDELAVRAQRLAERVPPLAKLGLAMGEQRADEALECLAQSRARDVALVLIELSGGEQPTRRYERFMQLVHHR